MKVGRPLSRKKPDQLVMTAYSFVRSVSTTEYRVFWKCWKMGLCFTSYERTFVEVRTTFKIPIIHNVWFYAVTRRAIPKAMSRINTNKTRNAVVPGVRYVKISKYKISTRIGIYLRHLSSIQTWKMASTRDEAFVFLCYVRVMQF